MDPKNPILTVRELTPELLRTQSPSSTSTSDQPIRPEARETVALVMARALRRAGKL